jgi:hypothetical protein
MLDDKDTLENVDNLRLDYYEKKLDEINAEKKKQVKDNFGIYDELLRY